MHGPSGIKMRMKFKLLKLFVRFSHFGKVIEMAIIIEIYIKWMLSRHTTLKRQINLRIAFLFHTYMLIVISDKIDHSTSNNKN